MIARSANIVRMSLPPGTAPRFVLSPDGDVIDEYSGEAVSAWFPDRGMPFTVDGLEGDAALERLALGMAAIQAGRP